MRFHGIALLASATILGACGGEKTPAADTTATATPAPAATTTPTDTGAAAAATFWGSWRGTRWTPIAAVAYGALTTALLLALPALLNLPPDARAGIRAGAAAVLLFALLSAAYFRANARQSGRQISTERANDR